MNITKRRMFPALLTILLFATLLAGCAGKQSDAGQNDASQNDASQKEITCAANLEGARIGVQLGTTGDISTYRTMKAMKQEPKSSVITRVQMLFRH